MTAEKNDALRLLYEKDKVERESVKYRKSKLLDTTPKNSEIKINYSSMTEINVPIYC